MPSVPRPAPRTLLAWLPVVALSGAHFWMVQRCLAELGPAQLPDVCSTPPLTTLALLVLAYVELTRGTRVRGTLALSVVAFPVVMSIVAGVIN